MENIIVRDARRTEIPALAKIQCMAWRAAFADIITRRTMEKYTDAEHCRHMLERIYDSGAGHMYIAGVDGKACGTLFWRPKDSRTVEIAALHALRRVWGAGVGQALMDKALTDIFNEGYFSAELWVFKENIRARKFYEKNGFTLTGGERISDYDRALELQYRRLL